MWLDMRLSWKFLNLNVAFHSVVKEPTRSLYVYSDVGSSSMVGNKMADLLREIKYQREGRGSAYFEPLHIHYIPVHNQVTEIIEVQVAETLGTGEDLVKFGDGHTILTLHFQKLKVENKTTTPNASTARSSHSNSVTYKKKKNVTRIIIFVMPKVKRRRRRQRGGIAPLAALVPGFNGCGKSDWFRGSRCRWRFWSQENLEEFVEKETV